MSTSSMEEAILSQGRIYVWGDNSEGNLGIPNPKVVNKSTPTLLEMKTSLQFLSIAAGLYHTLALSDLGEVYSWGRGENGRLGHGINESVNTPTVIKSLQGLNVVSIATGHHHSMALTSKGGLYCWGSGWSGQLGSGSSSDLNVPTFIEIVKLKDASRKFVKLAAGYHHSLALTDDGRLYSWGYGEVGQLGLGNVKKSTTPSLVDVPNVVFIDISASENHTLALSDTGDIYSWGYNRYGQLGYSTDTAYEAIPKKIIIPDNTKFTSIAAGSNHSLATSASGKIYYWGRLVLSNEIYNHPTVFNVPNAFFVTVSTRLNHCLALTDKGQIYSLGYNELGQCGTSRFDPVTSFTFVTGCNGLYFSHIVAGGNHSIALIGQKEKRRLKASSEIRTPLDTPSTSESEENSDAKELLRELIMEEQKLFVKKEQLAMQEEELFKEKMRLLELERVLSTKKSQLLKSLEAIL